MNTFEQDLVKWPCGCKVTDASASGNRVLVAKCPEAERLWDELIRFRDELRADDDRRPGWRVGHKNRRDVFENAREAYHDHVFGEGAWRNARRQGK